MNILNFLSENLQTIASTFIALTALHGTIYTAKNQNKTKSMELYFEAQLKAYTDLFRIISEMDKDPSKNETRDLRKLVMYAKSAEILSPYNLAKVIDNFCSWYIDYLLEMDIGELSEETYSSWKKSLSLMSNMMREELLRHGNIKRKSDKIFKKIVSKSE